MKIVPINCLPASNAVCWMCSQGFEGDELFSYVLRPDGEGKRAYATCIGCSVQLACDPGNLPAAE